MTRLLRSCPGPAYRTEGDRAARSSQGSLAGRSPRYQGRVPGWPHLGLLLCLGGCQVPYLTENRAGSTIPLPTAIPVVAALPQLFQTPSGGRKKPAVSSTQCIALEGGGGRDLMSPHRPRCCPFSLISGQNTCSSDPCCLSHISGLSLTLSSPICLSMRTVGLVCQPSRLLTPPSVDGARL